MATTPAPSAELLVKETSQIARDGEDGGDEEALSLLLGRVVAAIPAGSTSRRRAFERLASQLGKFSTAEDINVFLRALQAVVILRPKGVDARSRDVPEDALSTLLEDEPLALLPTLTARGPPPDETTGKVWHILDGTRDLHPLVCDGMIHRDNLRWLIQELLSVTDLKRHWAEAWALLELLPRSQMEENGRTFVATLLEVMIAAPPFKISEVAGIIAFLTCSHRVQLHVVEDTLVEFLVSQGSHPPARADLTDAKVWWLVSKLLVHWFPRTKGSSWGWSRPGWTWQEWLLLTDRLLERLPEAQAFDVLKGAVEAMEDMDGEKLHAQPCWTASRLEKLRGRMRALAGLTDDAMLSARLGPLGVWGPLHAGARVQLRGLVAEVSLNGKKGVCRNYQPPGVCFTMAVSLGRYAELLASPLLLSGFKARVSEAVAEVAASGARLSTGPEAKVVGLRPEHVDVAMSAGAPGLKVSIAPPADVAFDAVQSRMASSSKALLLPQAVVEKVTQSPSIVNDMTVKTISPPTVEYVGRVVVQLDEGGQVNVQEGNVVRIF